MIAESAVSKSNAAPEQRGSLWCAIVATYLSTSMGGAVSLVLPIIALQLALPAYQVQWVIGGYLLARVALLKIGGTLCDLLGSRLVFVTGLSLFGLFSLLCSMVSGADTLITLRIMQGASAALLSPASLLVVRGSVPPQGEARALSYWSLAAIVAQGGAPVLGGYLADTLGWPSIFSFCGVASALLVAVYLFVSKAPAQAPRKPGALAALLPDVAVSAVLVGLALLINDGYLWVVGGVLLVILAASLVAVRHRLRQPGYLLGVLARVPIVLTGLGGFGAVTIALLWGSYFVQRDLHMSAMMFGASCVPFGVLGIASTPLADRLMQSQRYATSFVIGGVAIVGAAAAAYLAEQWHSYALAATVMAALGVGYAFINGSISAALLHTYPAANSGGAASIASLSKQFGQLVGVSAFAAYRDFSGSAAGSDERLFIILGTGGAVMLISAMLSGVLQRRSAAGA